MRSLTYILVIVSSLILNSELGFSQSYRDRDNVAAVVDNYCILDSEVNKFAIGMVISDEVKNGIPFDPMSLEGLEVNSELYNLALKQLIIARILQIECRSIGINVTDDEVHSVLEGHLKQSGVSSIDPYTKMLFLFSIRNLIIEDRIRSVALSGQSDIYSEKQIEEINEMRKSLPKYDALFSKASNDAQSLDKKQMKKISIVELTVSKELNSEELGKIDRLTKEKSLQTIALEYFKDSNKDVNFTNRGWLEYNSLSYRYKELLASATKGFLTDRIDFGDVYKYIYIQDLMFESELSSKSKRDNTQVINLILSSSKRDVFHQAMYTVFDRHYVEIIEKDIK